MEIGLVRKINIDQEMQQSYLDYAMSTIVARALPDARDGLKPVHRRILYAMYDMGLRPSSGYKKSARVVGEVLGKYHPHSDQAVYDAMARMAQTFSMRLPLVDGQGNFGSVDGDPPAAMRYTEARMALPTMDIMADIQKNSVDFKTNFDETMTEPSVLPAAIPNLLVNGAIGIAVGMSTSVPPHNLGEVVDACIYMLENWSKIDDISIADLMQFVKGPDFPTGGIVLEPESDEDDLAAAYGKGRGRVTVQARVHLEEMTRGRERIIVTELPYMVNKSSLIERIAKLVRGGSLEGISDLRDESDRRGMRMVIELSKNADSEKVLEALYKRTQMRNTFSIIMLALVDGEPRMLSLKQAVKVYLDHRQVIIRRRSEYDLKRARDRAHILEGLRIALSNLDEVIKLIRNSRTVETARANLRKKFKLSEIQAQAILDMPLRRLAALERKKIEDEHKELQKTIKGLVALLKSPKKMRAMVGEELLVVKEKFQDRRRTQIVSMEEGMTQADLLTASDLVPSKEAWIAIHPNGNVARMPDGKTPRPSGSAAPSLIVKSNTRDTLYLVAANGETAAIAVHALPENENPENGVHYSKVSPLREKDKLTTAFSLPPVNKRAENWFVTTATRGGMVKKSEIAELPGPSSQTFVLAKTKDGDEVAWVSISSGESDYFMVTANGRAIRFKEDIVRPMGLLAAGVGGMKLKVGDEIIGFAMVNPEHELFLVTSAGKAKRVKIGEFPTQGRNGQGVVAWKLTDGERLAGIAHDKPNQRITVHLARLAAKSQRIDEAKPRKRASSGTVLIEVKAGDRVTSVVAPWESPAGVLIKDAPPKKKAAPKPKETGKKAPAKKAPAKKAAGKKKAPAKKTPARKTAAKKKAGSKKNQQQSFFDEE